MAHRLIITLGSNYNRQANIRYAIGVLADLVPIVDRSEPVMTEPIDFPYNADLFANIVLLCQTEGSQAEVLEILHRLERDCGRTSESRATHPERIDLDADLIAWDGEVLKPRDLSRPYLHDGLLALGIDPTYFASYGLL